MARSVTDGVFLSTRTEQGTSRRVFPEDQTCHPDDDEQHRRERKDGVVRQGGPHARGLVIGPGSACLHEQLHAAANILNSALGRSTGISRRSRIETVS